MKKAITLSILLAGQMAVSAQTTKVQVIHNCADAVADSVDVYLGNTKLLDNFAFRTATPFIGAPTGVPLVLGVAPKNSMSVNDTIYSVTVTLDASKKYILVANGIVSATGYTPSSTAAPFRLSVYDMARQTATTAGNTDILVMHGSTDAPTVDVKAGSSTLVDNISFGEFCSTGYLSVPEMDYTLDVTPGSGSPIVKRYSAPLATLNLGDSAITVLASGFLDSTVNSNGKSFGLWVALPQGGALLALPALPLPTATGTVVNAANIQVFPNPTTDIVNIKSDVVLSSAVIYDIMGKELCSDRNSNNPQFNISTFPSGVYMVKIETAAGELKMFRISKS